MIVENNSKFNQSDLEPHKGIWLIIRNHKNEIFMLNHKKFGQWTILLEKSEPEEDIDDAIIRSGKEEVGIDIHKYKIVDQNVTHFLRNNVLLHIEYFLVEVLDYDGIPQNLEPEKHSEVGWKNKDFILNLPDELEATKSLKEYIRLK